LCKIWSPNVVRKYPPSRVVTWSRNKGALNQLSGFFWFSQQTDRWCAMKIRVPPTSPNRLEQAATSRRAAKKYISWLLGQTLYTICCSIHTVCCKHVLIHCPSTASDGLIGLASVNGLHQEPLPRRSCLLVWSVYVCSEASVFTFCVEWPIKHLKWAFLASREQHFIFFPRLLLANW